MKELEGLEDQIRERKETKKRRRPLFKLLTIPCLSLMFGWHHRLNEHEFEQTPGDGGG